MGSGDGNESDEDLAAGDDADAGDARLHQRHRDDANDYAGMKAEFFPSIFFLASNQLGIEDKEVGGRDRAG